MDQRPLYGEALQPELVVFAIAVVVAALVKITYIRHSVQIDAT